MAKYEQLESFVKQLHDVRNQPMAFSEKINNLGLTTQITTRLQQDFFTILSAILV